MDLANFERRANSGAPVVGARVTLYAATAIDPTTPLATTFTDANGYWAFLGLAQGAYDLLVEAPGSGYKKWYKGQARIGVDQLAVSSGFSPAAGTVPGASLVSNSVTTTQIADGTIQNIDVNAAAGIAITKLADVGSGKVLRSSGAGNVAGQVQPGDIAAGGTGNRVLRTPDGVTPLWGQVGTLDIAPGATLGFWSVVGAPANYAGTQQNSISGASLSITMAGANPLLFGVSLMSIYNLTAPATLTVQMWEGAGALVTVGQVSINASEMRGLAKTFSFVPTAGAHTYFLTWGVSAGTVAAAEFSFWAMEMRR